MYRKTLEDCRFVFCFFSINWPTFCSFQHRPLWSTWPHLLELWRTNGCFFFFFHPFDKQHKRLLAHGMVCFIINIHVHTHSSVGTHGWGFLLSHCSNDDGMENKGSTTLCCMSKMFFFHIWHFLFTVFMKFIFAIYKAASCFFLKTLGTEKIKCQVALCLWIYITVILKFDEMWQITVHPWYMDGYACAWKVTNNTKANTNQFASLTRQSVVCMNMQNLKSSIKVGIWHVCACDNSPEKLHHLQGAHPITSTFEQGSLSFSSKADKKKINKSQACLDLSLSYVVCDDDRRPTKLWALHVLSCN